MKKILSILGTIYLSTIISTNIIACNPTNENKKLKNQTKQQFIPQQPPKNSNWKLITNKYIERDTGWYIIIYKSFNNWRIEKINSSKNFGSNTGYPMDIIYKWKLNNEPTNLQLPTINKNTGEITNWNEK
ncbi:MAG: lipoprotein [Spiroplasma sp. hy2]|uniref:lipoprotein n=1 Tax=Spiroplasma sp. hy2 TaxID=2490850 RepID=UPI003848A0A4